MLYRFLRFKFNQLKRQLHVGVGQRVPTLLAMFKCQLRSMDFYFLLNNRAVNCIVKTFLVKLQLKDWKGWRAVMLTGLLLAPLFFSGSLAHASDDAGGVIVPHSLAPDVFFKNVASMDDHTLDPTSSIPANTAISPNTPSVSSDSKNTFVSDHNATYIRYRHVIWGVLIVLSGQSLAIGLLWFALRQRALSEKHLRIFHTALEQCPVAALVVNSEFQVEFVNRQYCQESRLSFSQAVGKSLFGLQGFPFSRNECISRLSGEALWRVEALCHGHDGQLRHHRFLMSATRRTDGSVSHYVVLRENIDAQKRAEAQLVFQANYDALTELPNRALLTTKIRQAIEQANRLQTRFAVLFLDLDGYKQINDYFGHKLGDKFLVQVADRIADTVGRHGFVARMGGDEFVVLMPLAEGVCAGDLAQKLINTVQQPLILTDKQAYLSVSIGIALYPNHGRLADTLLQHADLAMYTSKSEGRAGYRFYEDQMGRIVQRRAKLEVSLHHAVSENQLRLVYQPVVDVHGCVVSCEALVRWHCEHGDISPDEFIPLAEQTGYIHQLGDWVLREAARQFQQWSSLGIAPSQIAVNVSFNQFQRASILTSVERCLADFPALRGHLTLEITERVLVEDLSPTLGTLHALKALGCRLAIDDFGTGYSSLSYLAQYPFDVVKIDRRFLQDISEDGVAMRLLNGITTLAQALSLGTIVEGVEDQPLWQRLAPLGIDGYQGYGISRGLNAEAFEQFMYRCLDEGPNFVLGAFVEQADDEHRPVSKKVKDKIQEDVIN